MPCHSYEECMYLKVQWRLKPSFFEFFEIDEAKEK